MKKYRFAEMILSDGDKFAVQEEKPGENPYNPSGIGIHTFHHSKYLNVEELPTQEPPARAKGEYAYDDKRSSNC